MRRPALTLLFLAFLAFFLGLGRMPITDADEAFYARAAWEMVERGDWLTPYFNGEQRWQKPVLYYWLTAGLYLVTGPTEWAARFWSALAGLGLVFLTWHIAGQWIRRDDAAFLAGAIVATCFGCFTMARMALPDLPLAFCITLTVWAVLRAVDAPMGGAPGAGAAATSSHGTRSAAGAAHLAARAAGVASTTLALPTPATTRTPRLSAMRWWSIAGLAAGLGFLVKGPVALVLPALVLAPIWWYERSRLTLDVRGILRAALLCAVVGVPWYAAMWFEHGSAYLQSFFVGDNLERFATDRFNEPRGVLFYVPVLIGGLLPWSLFLLILPVPSMARWLRTRRPLSTVERRLLCWAGMPLLFYTISLGKQPRYILPVLVPLSMLLAHVLVRRIEEAAARRGVLALPVATWATAGLFVVCAAVLARTQPLFLGAYPWATWVGMGALGALAVAIGAVAALRAWCRLPAVLTVSAAVLILAVQFGALAGIRPSAVEEMAAMVRAHRAADEPAGTYGVFVRNLGFYTGFPHVELSDDEGVFAFLQSPGRVLLVLREADFSRFQAESDLPMRRLERVRYVDTARIRLGTLLRPDPARDVQDVVLVTNR